MTWYIVRSLSGREPRAEVALIEAGFAVYLPRLAFWHWPARAPQKRRIERPLLPGYLFVSVPPPERFDLVRAVDGIQAFLNRNGQPASVPDGVVSAFRAAEAMGEFDRTKRPEPAGAYRPGQAVSIVKGHFADWPAQVIAMDGPTRVKVLLTAFGRQHEKTLDVGSLKVA